MVNFKKLKEKVGKENFLKEERIDDFGDEDGVGGGEVGGEKEEVVESPVEMEAARRTIFSFRD